MGTPRAIVACGALLVGALPGCGAPGPATEDGVEERATRLVHEVILVDTHIDVPYRLSEKMEDISARTAGGHFDFPRAREGGLDAAFMSIYVPASYQEEGGAGELADRLIDMVEKLAADRPDKFAVARSPEDVRRNFQRGVMSLALGIENGAAIEGSLDNLRHFYDRGVRYVTLTHSENNDIGDSSYATERRWNGLSPFGKEVVAEMNRLGMMIDVSHVSDATFEDVLKLSKAPVIASHSSCRAFTPRWERNMSDDMIRRLGRRGGTIQINFGSAFLLAEAQRQSTVFWRAAGKYRKEHGLDSGDDEAKRFAGRYWASRQRVLGDVSDVAAHVDHAVRLAGIEHVGLGSDFDGVDAVPAGLDDVSRYPNLVRALLDRGYSDEDIEKICGGNVLRVWSEVERVATEARP